MASRSRKYLYSLAVLTTLCLWHTLAIAEQVYLAPKDFLGQVFAGAIPDPKVLWITKSLRAEANAIMTHSKGPRRIRYWNRGTRSAWILEEIGKVKPDRIYTNHYSDLNVDHKVVFNATLTACRPSGSPVKELLTFEVLSSTEWSYPYNFNPNYFINVEKYVGEKIKAMKSFESEIRKFPHPRSSENIEHVVRRWGSVSGFKAAEAFELIRRIDK